MSIADLATRTCAAFQVLEFVFMSVSSSSMWRSRASMSRVSRRKNGATFVCGQHAVEQEARARSGSVETHEALKAGKN